MTLRERAAQAATSGVASNSKSHLWRHRQDHSLLYDWWPTWLLQCSSVWNLCSIKNYSECRILWLVQSLTRESRRREHNIKHVLAWLQPPTARSGLWWFISRLHPPGDVLNAEFHALVSLIPGRRSSGSVISIEISQEDTTVHYLSQILDFESNSFELD